MDDAAPKGRSGETPPEIAIILSSVEDGLNRLRKPDPDLDGVCDLLRVIALAAGAPISGVRDRRPVVLGPEPASQIVRGGLSRWQQKRVVGLMASLDRDAPSVSELAEACRLSNSYFIKAFKQTFGVTPRRWRRQLRIEQAKSLLASNDLSIAEIALVCGFADQSHLTRVFGQVVGVPPARWRRYSDRSGRSLGGEGDGRARGGGLCRPPNVEPRQGPLFEEREGPTRSVGG